MIKANVKYTGEHMWACHKAYSAFDWRFVTDIMLTGLIAVFTFGICLYLLPFLGKTELITKSIFIYAFLCVLNIFFIIFSVIKKQKKKKEIKTNIPNQFVNNISFDDKEFLHKYNSDDEWGFRRCGYDMLQAATETKHFFLIRIDKTKVCVIGKHEITEGTCEELSELLTEKLGKKFRRKCR